MKLTASITALLASGAFAQCHAAPDKKCRDTSVLSDYSTLERREVGARNTLVRNCVLTVYVTDF